MLVLFTTVNCSSNNNEPTPPSKEVKKVILSSYTFKITDGDNIDSYIIDLVYDKNNNVQKHIVKNEVTSNSKLIDNTTYTFNYIYNDNQQLVSVQETNDKNNKYSILEFEYDNLHQMTKLYSKNKNYEVNFSHNEKKQIDEAFLPTSSTIKNMQLQYDNNGNLTNVSTNDNPNISESYTYDNHKNPFQNMPINIQLDLNMTMATDIKYYYTPVNNIYTYKLGLREIGTIQYEYNSDDYPITSKRTLDGSIITETFTYKIVKE